MPIHAIERIYDTSDPPVEIGVRLVGIGENGVIEFLYSDIPGQSWTPARIEIARQWVQDRIDVRFDRATLPPDDPMIVNGDPALLWLFWDGTDVVVRTMAITNITFDGNICNFTLTKFSRRGWGE